jgi:hypothetical protein
MQQMIDRLTDAKAMSFIKQIEDVFKSLPHLPQGIVDFLAMIAPWFALIGAVLNLVAGPIIGLFSVISLISLNPFLVLGTFLAAVLSLVTAALLFMAFTPLRNRELKGWVYIFWSNILSAVLTIYGVVFSGTGIGSLIGMVIGFYFLFEMKRAYEGSTKKVDSKSSKK